MRGKELRELSYRVTAKIKQSSILKVQHDISYDYCDQNKLPITPRVSFGILRIYFIC